jgi:hypothetical protein
MPLQKLSFINKHKLAGNRPVYALAAALAAAVKHSQAAGGMQNDLTTRPQTAGSTNTIAAASSEPGTNPTLPTAAVVQSQAVAASGTNTTARWVQPSGVFCGLDLHLLRSRWSSHSFSSRSRV